MIRIKSERKFFPSRLDGTNILELHDILQNITCYVISPTLVNIIKINLYLCGGIYTSCRNVNLFRHNVICQLIYLCIMLILLANLHLNLNTMMCVDLFKYIFNFIKNGFRKDAYPILTTLLSSRKK